MTEVAKETVAMKPKDFLAKMDQMSEAEVDAGLDDLLARYVFNRPTGKKVESAERPLRIAHG